MTSVQGDSARLTAELHARAHHLLERPKLTQESVGGANDCLALLQVLAVGGAQAGILVGERYPVLP